MPFYSHVRLCVSLDYYYFYFYLFCLFGRIPPLFIFYSFVLSLPCRTLCLSQLLLFLFLYLLSFWTDPDTISFLLLLALPPMQDFGSLEILFLFFILVIDISVLSFDISAPKMQKYPHPLFFISCSLCLLN